MKSKDVQKSNNEQTTRSAPSIWSRLYVLPSQKWRGVPLQTEALFSENLNFSREFISNHIVSFPRNQALSHCVCPKIFLYVGLLNFLYVGLLNLSFFMLSWMWSHCNNWTTHHQVSTQADIMWFPSYKPYFHSASHAVWHVQHKSQWNIAAVIFNLVFWLSSRQHDLLHIHKWHLSVTSAIIASVNTCHFVPCPTLITNIIRAVQGTYVLPVKTEANIQSLWHWHWTRKYIERDRNVSSKAFFMCG